MLTDVYHTTRSIVFLLSYERLYLTRWLRCGGLATRNEDPTLDFGVEINYCRDVR
jgi:hypothetical protein